MAELDFSKIFASNSPLTPYTWSPSDYLEGWNTVGATPPARTQFDALQNITDLKLKYLNDIKAPINSPTFTGTPKAPTPAKNDNSTRIATTAWSRQWIDELKDAIDDIDLSGYAPLNSPDFTGTPTAPTPASTENSTQIATTAWVKTLIAGIQASDIVAYEQQTWWFYVKFKNNFIIQGGMQDCANPTGVNADGFPPYTTWSEINMPLTFTDNSYGIVVNADNHSYQNQPAFSTTFKLNRKAYVIATRLNFQSFQFDWSNLLFTAHWLAAGF